MRFYLISICLLLSACSGLSPVFKDVQVTDITYNQVSEDIDRYKNSIVRWGGVIIDVENNEDFSLMQLMFYPLDYYGRPQLNKPSEGRFVIKSAEFLHPEHYSADREIIAVGVIDGDIELTTSNKTSVWVPLIKATDIHLWTINYRNNYYSHCPSCYFRQLFW